MSLDAVAFKVTGSAVTSKGSIIVNCVRARCLPEACKLGALRASPYGKFVRTFVSDPNRR